MKLSFRDKKSVLLDVDGEEYSVEILEVPFREGVELRCVVGDEELRVSDRGLGDAEALRLMADEIRRLRSEMGI